MTAQLRTQPPFTSLLGSTYEPKCSSGQTFKLKCSNAGRMSRVCSGCTFSSFTPGSPPAWQLIGRRQARSLYICRTAALLRFSEEVQLNAAFELFGSEFGLIP